MIKSEEKSMSFRIDLAFKEKESVSIFLVVVEDQININF